MAEVPVRRRGAPRRLFGAAAVALCAVLAACSGSSAPDTSPLPSTASSGRSICGFVDAPSLQTALGISDLHADDISLDGGLHYLPASQHDLDGTQLQGASCGVTVLSDGGADQAFGAQVESVAERPDLVQNIVDDTAGARRAAYTFPTSYGTGIALSGGGGGHVELLRGNWIVLLGVDIPGPGRNAVKDSIALTEQVIATLELPEQPNKPYPAPAKS